MLETCQSTGLWSQVNFSNSFPAYKRKTFCSGLWSSVKPSYQLLLLAFETFPTVLNIYSWCIKDKPQNFFLPTEINVCNELSPHQNINLC